MPYSIRIREQIIPRYIVREGPYGLISRDNPGPEYTTPPTSSATIYSDLSGIYDADPGRRVELFEDAAGTAIDVEIFTACPYLKVSIIDQVKQIRAQALDKIAKCAGVLALYDENYKAACAFDEGFSGEIMKDGKTAVEYLTGLGSRLGMTAQQFAAYIISENRRVNPTAYAVEQEYLRLAYAVIPALTKVADVLSTPAEYRRFCGV